MRYMLLVFGSSYQLLFILERIEIFIVHDGIYLLAIIVACIIFFNHLPQKAASQITMVGMAIGPCGPSRTGVDELFKNLFFPIWFCALTCVCVQGSAHVTLFWYVVRGVLLACGPCFILSLSLDGNPIFTNPCVNFWLALTMICFNFSDSLSQTTPSVKTMVGMAVGHRCPSCTSGYYTPGLLLEYSWLSPLKMTNSCQFKIYVVL